jgi:hypothetical protein
LKGEIKALATNHRPIGTNSVTQRRCSSCHNVPQKRARMKNMDSLVKARPWGLEGTRRKWLLDSEALPLTGTSFTHLETFIFVFKP